MLYPIILKPVLKEYLWGGTQLKEKYGKETENETIAESWELSCHQEGASIISNRTHAGKGLDAYIWENGAGVLGKHVNQAELPLLVKFIDAADNLSIQVHPDECYAKQYENQPGKKEMWYIMDCDPDSSLYYGFSHSLSKEEFVARAKNGTITEVLNRVHVRPGDVFFIDSGVVHAIGRGMTVAEIGNNCNITYRIFDFFRKDKFGKPRELHLDKAADVAVLDIPSRCMFDDRGFLDCGVFKVQEIRLKGETELTADLDSFHNLLCLNGDCELHFMGEKVQVSQGISLFIPAGMGGYSLRGNSLLLKTTV